MRHLWTTGAVALLTAGPLAAQEAVRVAVPDPQLGAAVFADACAGCHGEEGRGDGPVAAMLTLAVPDLTGLSARAGGVFPWLRVVHVIDGRNALRAHGGAMPVFGGILTGDPVLADAPDGTPVETGARVLALVDWLRTVQEGGE